MELLSARLADKLGIARNENFSPARSQLTRYLIDECDSPLVQRHIDAEVARLFDRKDFITHEALMNAMSDLFRSIETKLQIRMMVDLGLGVEWGDESYIDFSRIEHVIYNHATAEILRYIFERKIDIKEDNSKPSLGESNVGNHLVDTINDFLRRHPGEPLPPSIAQQITGPSPHPEGTRTALSRPSRRIASEADLPTARWMHDEIEGEGSVGFFIRHYSHLLGKGLTREKLLAHDFNLVDHFPLEYEAGKRPGDNAATYFERNYMPWIGIDRCVTRSHLLIIDHKLTRAIDNWLQNPKHRFPPHVTLPTLHNAAQSYVQRVRQGEETLERSDPESALRNAARIGRAIKKGVQI